ncbi:hypothetical protein [Aureimonas phyllosphaerae]|uniref:Uncharacterized protein n=1 Tax=Aureimonas phyllosphaerae TaxID=1166078 RepID=A0A7W6BY04_9HYPH|nr:hypothetical protein [Aureimonas phyllosphaerae]MBB3938154.1 hypothetical protein [Aureimonas phyllosphaerae]MBB3962162.1 hypothetical protein [Aureimonas phyllosphaerae]SFF56623.1 hypothetical protein SAMN05216566_13018 [Aureimonas phyllosphaerae]
MTANDNSIASDQAADFVALTADLGFGPALGVEVMPEVPLLYATHLMRAVASGADPVAQTVQALRTILAAIPRKDLATAAPQTLRALREAVHPAWMRLTEASPRGVIPDDLALGMASVSAVVQMLEQPPAVADVERANRLFCERLDIIALLADQLDAAERRRRITENGGLVARLVAIQAAERRQRRLGEHVQ